jgi:hypothetical protein
MSVPDPLNAKQQRAVFALLAAPSIVEAARQAGVSEATLHRWLQLPAFREAYAAARQQLAQHALSGLQQAMRTATATLESVMGNKKVAAATRVFAAKVVLETSLRALEIAHLEDRLIAIELALKERPR